MALFSKNVSSDVFISVWFADVASSSSIHLSISFVPSRVLFRMPLRFIFLIESDRSIGLSSVFICSSRRSSSNLEMRVAIVGLSGVDRVNSGCGWFDGWLSGWYRK